MDTARKVVDYSALRIVRVTGSGIVRLDVPDEVRFGTRICGRFGIRFAADSGPDLRQI